MKLTKLTLQAWGPLYPGKILAKSRSPYSLGFRCKFVNFTNCRDILRPYEIGIGAYSN
jgi:hypothetical protein